MSIVVAPDKFKGSLSSFEVCKAITAGIKSAVKETDVLSFPMADGGDGFATVMKYYCQTTSIKCESFDPLGRPVTTSYEWDGKSQSAIIEMAAASGLVLLNRNERNPLQASSFGTGLMIKNAIEKGANKIILGLGGSATNDGGTGILSAMGFRFYNGKNDLLAGNGKALIEIKKIVKPALLPDIKFEIACDVQNKMYGRNGAAFVFAPQKGASAAQVLLLDQGLKHFAKLLEQETGNNISKIPGTGAAGGIAAGLMSFFEVEMKSGIEMVVAASGIQHEIQKASLLVTGEGRIDEQSGDGKVVGYLSSLAAKHQVPCNAICGELALDENGVNKLGLHKIVALLDHAHDRGEAMTNANELLVKLAAGIIDL